MLKAQLKSKIGALGASWQEVEDILTGDFFGVLDYLPRTPFLPAFLDWIGTNNPDTRQPPRDAVEWDGAEFIFWPRLAGEDDAAEPDVVIATNRWILIIEVKLNSGLGKDQAHREYSVGRSLARDRGLPDDAVFFLLVARRELSLTSTIRDPDAALTGLLESASHLPWHLAVALIESWLVRRPDSQPHLAEHTRLLGDLLAALRRRRAISFSGFELVTRAPVCAEAGRLFCPDRFHGFLTGVRYPPPTSIVGAAFLPTFSGFLSHAPPTPRSPPALLVARSFRGFLQAVPSVSCPARPVFSRIDFVGFLNEAPRCTSDRIWTVRPTTREEQFADADTDPR